MKDKACSSGKLWFPSVTQGGKVPDLEEMQSEVCGEKDAKDVL